MELKEQLKMENFPFEYFEVIPFEDEKSIDKIIAYIQEHKCNVYIYYFPLKLIGHTIVRPEDKKYIAVLTYFNYRKTPKRLDSLKWKRPSFKRMEFFPEERILWEHFEDLEEIQELLEETLENIRERL